MEDGVTEKTSIREQLLKAYRSGTFLEVVTEMQRASISNRNTLSHELAVLHNEGLMNLVESFTRVKKEEIGVSFFGLRRIFEDALPEIQSDVVEVVQCVFHLINEAGQDLAAGSTIRYLVSFLEKNPHQVDQAITFIENESTYHFLLSAALIAGCPNNMSGYLEKIIEYTRSGNSSIRKQAVYSLGQIDWTGEGNLREKVYATLASVSETDSDEEVLATTAQSAANLILSDPSSTNRLTGVIAEAINKGNNQTTYAAAQLLTNIGQSSPKDLIQILLAKVKLVNPEHKGTIDLISNAMANLIKNGMIDDAICVLETLLVEKELAPGEIEYVLNDLRCDSMLLSKAATRWLLSGIPSLCEAVVFLVDGGYRADIPLEVDPTEIDTADGQEVLFLAKKACGYLLMNTTSTASILMSLMQIAQDQRTRHQLAQLVLNPLLVNFPGSTRLLIKEKGATCSAEVQEELQKLDLVLSQYLSNLESMKLIPELFPSEMQRETYNRYYSRQLEKSYKEAEKNSIWSWLTTKQVILYGSATINYVHKGKGILDREEAPFKEHSVEYQLPRMALLSPIDLEYSLGMFRAERRSE